MLITQLKDEVESLKKQLALKEQQLLEKDKKRKDGVVIKTRENLAVIFPNVPEIWIVFF